MFVVPSSSESIILEYVLNRRAPEELVMKLYTNDVFPNHTSTEKDFVEPTGGGYAPINLLSDSWTIIPGMSSRAEHLPVSWKFNGPAGRIYGYFVTGQESGHVMWAERFEKAPFHIKTSGDEIHITPRLSLKNRNNDVE